MKEIITALIAAKGEIPAVSKEGVNPFHKSKYLTLDSILGAITPILSKHGLVIVQTTQSTDGRFELVTQLWHSSGEHLESVYALPTLAECGSLGGKTNPNQVMGSAITYGRRYAITALLGIAADEDDDGNAAQPRQQQRPAQQPQAQPITDPNQVDWTRFTDKASGQIAAPDPASKMDEQGKFVLGWVDAFVGIAPRGQSASYLNGYNAQPTKQTQE